MKPALSQRAAGVLGQIRKAGRTVMTVESCTAGALAVLLADAPGASEVFHGGFVVYTKASKFSVLGVPEDLIRARTAASREVAEAMAKGGVRCGPADIAVGITGVAGPERDEDGNPVGLVHVAAASRDGLVLHRAPGLGSSPAMRFEIWLLMRRLAWSKTSSRKSKGRHLALRSGKSTRASAGPAQSGLYPCPTSRRAQNAITRNHGSCQFGQPQVNSDQMQKE